MPTVTYREQQLFDAIKAALPRIFALAGQQEILWAIAFAFGQAYLQADTWLAETRILDSDGAWLDLHARELGTSRQQGETDAQLQDRLGRYPDTVTRAAVLAKTNSVLAQWGVTGTAAMVERRRDVAFATATGDADGAFASRGYRAGTGAVNGFWLLLPYGTSAEVANAVAEAVRLIRGSGLVVTVERRLVP